MSSFFTATGFLGSVSRDWCVVVCVGIRFTSIRRLLARGMDWQSLRGIRPTSAATRGSRPVPPARARRHGASNQVSRNSKVVPWDRINRTCVHDMHMHMYMLHHVHVHVHVHAHVHVTCTCTCSHLRCSCVDPNMFTFAISRRACRFVPPSCTAANWMLGPPNPGHSPAGSSNTRVCVSNFTRMALPEQLVDLDRHIVLQVFV